MLTAIEHDEAANGSASKIPCDSPLNEIRGLDHLKVRKSYPRGTLLFAEGQKPRGIYVICEGRVKVSIASADGRTLVLRIAKPGDVLGINSVLSGRPSEATVETLGRCQMDFVSREDLQELLKRDRNACLSVAHALGNKLTGVVGHARLLFLSQSAAEKLARLLVRWCEESGKRTPEGTRIEFRLTHEEIAQIICSSRETVTRLLADLKRKQIVSWSDNAIFIRNRKALDLAARS